MLLPRYWKKLERHPLSAEYPDLPPAAMKRFVENLKEHGVANGRKVTLLDGKVLDGWQLYTACLEAGVKPKFQPLPKGWEPEAYVEAMNDVRRHEDADTRALRAQKRRERVAAARSEGQSLRAIAEAEGVSETQVRNDLKAATAQGCAVEPPDGKVVGKDGKARPAERPPILCGRCRRVGPVKGCESCKLEREGARKGRDAGSHERNGHGPKNGQAVFDMRAFERAYGEMVRTTDNMCRAFRAVNTPANEGLLRRLAEFKKDFLATHAELKKRAAAACRN